MVKRSFIPITVLMLANIFLGLSGIFPKVINLSAQAIILGRSAVAIACFLPIIFFSKSNISIQSNVNKFKLFLISLLMAAHWLFFYKSIQASTVAIGVILIYTYPLLTAFIEPFWVKRKIHWSDYLFALLIICSVAIISGQNLAHGNIVFGIIYGLISALCLAVRNVLIKDVNETNNPISLMFYQNILTFIVLAPFAFNELFTASQIDLQLVITVGVLSSVIGHTLYVKSLEYYSATSVGIITSFQVIYAVILAWIILSEEITLRVLVGGLLTIYVVIHHMIIKKNIKS